MVEEKFTTSAAGKPQASVKVSATLEADFVGWWHGLFELGVQDFVVLGGDNVLKT